MKRAVALFLFVLIFPTLSPAEDCHETVRIDTTHYSVGPRWCGKKIDTALIANESKLVRIPTEYCAENFRIYVTKRTRNAFVEMAKAAKKDGVTLIAESGYRSSRYQRAIIRRRLAAGDSFEKIMKSVAPPGYSEHETGRALDLSTSDAGFVRTDAYKWLKQHASSFGFSESFPKLKSGAMPYEPWHWCYKKPR